MQAAVVTNIIPMNSILSNFPDTVDFQQLPSCLEGTMLKIDFIQEENRNVHDEHANGIMWHEDNTTYQLSFQTDLLNYAGYIEPPNNNEIQIWFRLFMCSIEHVGYCHPMLDSTEWDTMYSTIKHNSRRF